MHTRLTAMPSRRNTSGGSGRRPPSSSSADLMDRTRSRKSSGSAAQPSFAAPTRSSSHRRASARGLQPEQQPENMDPGAGVPNTPEKRSAHTSPRAAATPPSPSFAQPTNNSARRRASSQPEELDGAAAGAAAAAPPPSPSRTSPSPSPSPSPSFAAPTRSSGRRRAAAPRVVAAGEPEPEAPAAAPAAASTVAAGRSSPTALEPRPTTSREAEREAARREAERSAAAIRKTREAQRERVLQGSSAAARKQLRRSQSDLARQAAASSSPSPSPVLSPSPILDDVTDEQRRKAEEEFLSQRADVLERKRRAEAQAAKNRASPTPDTSDDERQRAEAEFLAERDKMLQKRKRAEAVAVSQDPTSPAGASAMRASISPRESAMGSSLLAMTSPTVTDEEIAMIQAEEELLVPSPVHPGPSERATPSGVSEEVSCEDVLLVYYAHFEPAFATREKVEKIVKTFRARSERLGEPGQFREKMFSAIAAQRDVHPLEFWRSQQQQQPPQLPQEPQPPPQQRQPLQQRPPEQQEPEEPGPPPIKQPKKKQGFKQKLGFESKRPSDRASRPPTQLSPEAENAFSPRKSLSRTPPSSPPTATADEFSPPPPPPPKNDERPRAVLVSSPQVDPPSREFLVADCASLIQAVYRGHQVRAEIERIAGSGAGEGAGLIPTQAEGPVGSPMSFESALDSPPRLDQIGPGGAPDLGSPSSDGISVLSADDSSPRDEIDDVAVLMEFYNRIEPTFANEVKITRIVERFRSRSMVAGEHWRDAMYDAIAKQRGNDPRDGIGSENPLSGQTISLSNAGSLAMVGIGSDGAASVVSAASAGEPARPVAWQAEPPAVTLQLSSVMLACAHARLHWARIMQSRIPSRQLKPNLRIAVANALSGAVAAHVAQRLTEKSRREILSLSELKRVDSARSNAKRQQYDDEEAVKVMRQVRQEVSILAKELGASRQQMQHMDVQRIFEELGPGAKRRLQPICTGAVEASCLIAQLQLEQQFRWGLNDGDSVALMEDLLVLVDDAKTEREVSLLSKREGAMMGARRAASLKAGIYELLRETAVRSHPGCLTKYVGTVAPGERVRVAKAVCDKSGFLFAKVDEEGLHGWVALGPRPAEDEQPLMKLLTRAEVLAAAAAAAAAEHPLPPVASSISSAAENLDSKTAKRDRSAPATPPTPTPTSPRGTREWRARESTQAERFAQLRQELGRDSVSSPVTRGLEDKLQALEQQLGSLSTSGGPEHRENIVRASWSPNATTGGIEAGGPRHERQKRTIAGSGYLEQVWGVDEVVDWLVQAGLGEYGRSFSENSMDGEAMFELERWRRRAYEERGSGNEGSLFAECLRGLGMTKTGHVLKLCRYLEDGVSLDME